MDPRCAPHRPPSRVLKLHAFPPAREGVDPDLDLLTERSPGEPVTVKHPENVCARQLPLQLLEDLGGGGHHDLRRWLAVPRLRVHVDLARLLGAAGARPSIRVAHVETLTRQLEDSFSATCPEQEKVSSLHPMRT